MNIGLIDCDSHNFPNLALMKLSAHHKNQGDQVEMHQPFSFYDKVYCSKVFDNTYTPDIDFVVNTDKLIFGGVGYDLQNKLPDEVEHIYPDYELYKGYENIAYGYLTRGCPRGCKFCIVGEQQGLKSVKVADLDEFWKGQKEIKLLDPNITASKDCLSLFDDLIASKAWVDFTQGIDIRCMSDEKINKLNQMKIKMIHFAWDNYEFSTYELFKKFRPSFKISGRRLRVYVLTNFDTTHEQDLERIYKLRELDYDPFVMIYDKPSLPRGHRTRKMARWVNNKFIWRVCENFDDYMKH